MRDMPDRQGHQKSDRALQLLEQGLKRSQIAERLGVPPKNIAGMIQRARQRRERVQDEVQV